MNRRSRNIITHALSRKKVRLGLLLIVGLFVFVGLGNRLVTGTSSQSNGSSGNGILGDKQNIEVEVDQSIEIPIGEDNVITYTITTAELQDSIVIRGQQAYPVDGKQFLVLNLKLSNTETQRVRLDTRDFIRLSVNDSPDRLAPAIHNDPVELQPISDQYTRLGFSVFLDDADYKLFLGEITEEKIEIPLEFN